MCVLIRLRKTLALLTVCYGSVETIFILILATANCLLVSMEFFVPRNGM